MAKGGFLRLGLTFVCAGALVMWRPSASLAQKGSLHGMVVDSAGSPIAGADVSIPTLRRLARTNDSGRFVLTKLPVGSVEVSVRRLAYDPTRITTDITTSGADTVRIAMSVSVALLNAVNVVAGEMRRREQVEDFYRRSAQGLGMYVTRADIEKREGGAPSDMLRNMPGIRFVRVASGRGVRFPTTSISRRDCAPLMWIDGQRAASLEIDDISLRDIEGIELYNGPATTPFQFSSNQSTGCGTIAVWTRPPTPRRNQ